MGGLLTNGMNLGALYTGNERAPWDTNLTAGANPQVEAITLLRLATLTKYYGSTGDRTTVAGSRYYVSTNVGSPPAANPGIGSPVSPTSPPNTTITGIAILMGSVGGTDNLIVELHDSTGAIVATSALAGTLAGTANVWQQIPFTAPYSAPAGTYFAVVQSNGTTAKPAVVNSPTSPHLTGSATGAFGTSAAITPPTTYTTGLGPSVLLY